MLQRPPGRAGAPAPARPRSECIRGDQAQAVGSLSPHPGWQDRLQRAPHIGSGRRGDDDGSGRTGIGPARRGARAPTPLRPPRIGTARPRPTASQTRRRPPGRRVTLSVAKELVSLRTYAPSAGAKTSFRVARDAIGTLILERHMPWNGSLARLRRPGRFFRSVRKPVSFAQVWRPANPTANVVLV